MTADPASRKLPMPFLRLVVERYLALPGPGVTSVAFWRQRIVDLMLLAGAILGFLAWVPSVLLSLRVHYWSVAVADTLALAWVVVAALSPGWSYRTRVRGLIALLYLLALVLMTRLGSSGAGLIWISALPLIAAVLLGLRAALNCWLLALATLAGIGWAIGLGLFQPPGPAVAGAGYLAAWVVNSANALFISALTALPTALLLRGLEHANRALSREEERFTKVFQLSPEAMAIHRQADGQFLAVNDAWCGTFGWSRAEALGRTAEDLGLWQDPADRIRMRQVLAATGTIGNQEVGLRRRDHTGFPALISGKVMDLQGEACLLVMSQDLTATREAERERLRLEGELRHSQKLESLGSLAGGVAHDMNNILAAILGLGSTLQAQYQGDPRLAEALGHIVRAGERGRKLVRGLTDFARKGLDDAHAVELNEIARREIELLRSTTLGKVRLLEDLEPDLPLVLGDASALHNAVMNLCVNAIDAMPEGGSLTFRTRSGAGGVVELTIVDSGRGMPPEVLARAMEPFFTTKPAGKGTGLGLAGVYGTMKAHGGQVEIHSEPGRGTEVLLRFPAAVLGAGAAPVKPEPAAEAAAEALRILVVDDDPIIVETLPAMLAFLGHQAQAAARGQEALDLLDAGLQVDLVVLDHNMPELSGAETLLRIRERRPNLPVILSTGYLEPAVEALAQSLPQVWLLNKPFTLSGMRDKLKRARPPRTD